jgi:hypothetical protein
MPRYLIEVAHPEEKVACLQIVQILRQTGSHYLSHCDWGCMEGVYKAWITVEVDSQADALRILPPLFRARAKVVRLEKFSLETVETMLSPHDSHGTRTEDSLLQTA